MTQDEIIEMAYEAGFTGTASEFFMKALERFAKLVEERTAAKEREACAKVCDSSIEDTYIAGYTGAKHSGRMECAAAIRKRGEA